MEKYFKRKLDDDNLIKYIEKYIFCSIDNEIIMQRFENMKTRLNQL